MTLVRLIITLVLLTAIPLAQAQTVITISRYAGMPNFEHSRQTRWVNTEHGFQQVEHPPISSSYSCATLLDLQQLFPLDQMVATKYLTTDSARYYKKLGLQLSPEQVSFLELSDTTRPRRLQSNQVANSLENFFTDQDLEVHASLWVIGGQTYDLETRQIKKSILPWQLEPKLAAVAQKIDREKYPLVWEWGRAAQVSPKEIDTLLASAALMQLKEVIAVGERTENAWITFHSLGPIHTRAYNQRFPKRIMHEDPVTHEAIFLVPLTEILEKLPPKTVSPFMKALDLRGFAPESAASLIQFFRQTELSELDWSTRDMRRMHNRVPLVVYDGSDYHSELFRRRLKAGGIEGEDADDIEQVVNQLPSEDFLPNHPQALDYALTPQTKVRIADRNAIYLTNIPPGAAEIDPEFIPKLLFSYLGTQFREFKRMDEWYLFTEFESFMKSNSIRYQIGSFDPLTIAQAEAVGKHITQQFKVTGSTQVQTALEIFEAVRKNGINALKPETKVYSAIELDAKTLFELMKTNPKYLDWFNSPIVVFQHGLGAAKRSLYNPLVF